MNDRTISSLLIALVYALVLALTLIACGTSGGTSSPPPVSGTSSSQLPASSSQFPASSSQLPASSSQSPDRGASQSPVSLIQAQGSAMAKAYREALEGIYKDHLYPNGDPVDTFQIENNDFAIIDVDGDGAKELLYRNDDSTTAGMLTTIYSFDPNTETLYQQLSGYVGMTVYDNGIVTIDASHNHGLSALEDFWPYTLYQYDIGGDNYLMMGSADAWDKSLFPQDWEGNPFPDDADQDGDGVVYLLTFGGQEVKSTVLDGPEYLLWRNAFIDGAAVLDIPWRTMTLENIQAIA